MLHQRPQDERRGSGDGSRQGRRLFCSRLPLIGLAVQSAFGGLGSVWGETPENDPGRPYQRESRQRGSRFLSDEVAKSTVQSLVDLVITKIPRSYASTKHWDKTKRVWAGVHVRRDGLKLKTKRKWRDVRHGRWTRYEVRFPGDPAAKPPIKAVVRSVHPDQSGDADRGGWKIVSEWTTPLAFDARIERWNLGVKLLSIGIEGWMNLSLAVESTLNSHLDYSEIPPAMVIDPRVVTARLAIHHLEVDRVSKVGSDVAEKWGDLAKLVAEEILMEDINQKLADKLNRAIDKHRDDLRLSASQWISQGAPISPKS